MTRTMTGFSGAVAAAGLLSAAFAGAQTTSSQGSKSSTSTARELVVVGCLTRQSGGHFLLTKSVDVAGRTPVGTSGAVASSTTQPERWQLETAGTSIVGDLAGKLGEQVEVRGRVMPAASSKKKSTAQASSTGATQTPMAGRVMVEAVVPVAGTCP